MSQDPVLPGETPTTERAKRPQPQKRNWRLRGDSSVNLGDSKSVNKDPVKRELFPDHAPEDSNHDAVSKEGEVVHPEGEEEEVKEDDPCEDPLNDVSGIFKDSVVRIRS